MPAPEANTWEVLRQRKEIKDREVSVPLPADISLSVAIQLGIYIALALLLCRLSCLVLSCLAEI